MAEDEPKEPGLAAKVAELEALLHRAEAKAAFEKSCSEAAEKRMRQFEREAYREERASRSFAHSPASSGTVTPNRQSFVSVSSTPARLFSGSHGLGVAPLFAHVGEMHDTHARHGGVPPTVHYSHLCPSELLRTSVHEPSQWSPGEIASNSSPANRHSGHVHAAPWNDVPHTSCAGGPGACTPDRLPVQQDRTPIHVQKYVQHLEQRSAHQEEALQAQARQLHSVERRLRSCLAAAADPGLQAALGEAMAELQQGGTAASLRDTGNGDTNGSAGPTSNGTHEALQAGAPLAPDTPSLTHYPPMTSMAVPHLSLSNSNGNGVLATAATPGSSHQHHHYQRQNGAASAGGIWSAASHALSPWREGAFASTSLVSPRMEHPPVVAAATAVAAAVGPASAPAPARPSLSVGPPAGSSSSLASQAPTSDVLEAELARYISAFRGEQQRCVQLQAQLERERRVWGAERANLRYEWCGRWGEVPCLEVEDGVRVCMHWHLDTDDPALMPQSVKKMLLSAREQLHAAMDLAETLADVEDSPEQQQSAPGQAQTGRRRKLQFDGGDHHEPDADAGAAQGGEQQADAEGQEMATAQGQKEQQQQQRTGGSSRRLGPHMRAVSQLCEAVIAQLQGHIEPAAASIATASGNGGAAPHALAASVPSPPAPAVADVDASPSGLADPRALRASLQQLLEALRQLQHHMAAAPSQPSPSAAAAASASASASACSSPPNGLVHSSSRGRRGPSRSGSASAGSSPDAFACQLPWNAAGSAAEAAAGGGQRLQQAANEVAAQQLSGGEIENILRYQDMGAQLQALKAARAVSRSISTLQAADQLQPRAQQQQQTMAAGEAAGGSASAAASPSTSSPQQQRLDTEGADGSGAWAERSQAEAGPPAPAAAAVTGGELQRSASCSSISASAPGDDVGEAGGSASCFQAQLELAQLEILELVQQVDELSSQRALLAAVTDQKNRELELLAMSEADAVSELATLKATLDSERSMHLRLQQQCEELQKRLTALSVHPTLGGSAGAAPQQAAGQAPADA